MTTRYYAEEPCLHGGYEKHSVWGMLMCPGGSRRELVDVETVEATEGYKLSTLQGVPVRKPGRYAIIPLPPEADE